MQKCSDSLPAHTHVNLSVHLGVNVAESNHITLFKYVLVAEYCCRNYH